MISRELESLTMSLVTADYGGVSQQKCLCVLTIIWWFDVSDVCGSVGWIMAQDTHCVDDTRCTLAQCVGGFGRLWI